MFKYFHLVEDVDLKQVVFIVTTQAGWRWGVYTWYAYPPVPVLLPSYTQHIGGWRRTSYEDSKDACFTIDVVLSEHKWLQGKGYVTMW